MEVHRSGPASLPALYKHLHLITVFLRCESIVVRYSAKGAVPTRLSPGDSSIRAAGAVERVEWPAGG